MYELLGRAQYRDDFGQVSYVVEHNAMDLTNVTQQPYSGSHLLQGGYTGYAM